MFSRLVALILLVASLPLLLILWVGVRATMSSPAIFRQTRSGKDGTVFRLIKFRSMTDARDGQGELRPDIERITPLGAFLRRSRLDELPGLINIARGEMAFVGPRPLLPETIAAAGQAGQRRGFVKPGLTGWAQVNGNTLLSNEEKIALDLWYIENANGWLDLQIVWRTLAVVVGGERRNDKQLRNSGG